MNKRYTKKDLIQEIIRKNCSAYLSPTIYELSEKPYRDFLTCSKCGFKHVPIKFERFGDGTEYGILWVTDTWSGFCRRRECNSIMIYTEFMDYEILRKENLRIFSELCDRVLNQLN